MKGLFSFFSKRAETPIETRDYGKVYFVLSALLFIGTMWAVVDEVSTRRPWKEIQEKYFALSAQQWEGKLQEARAAFDSASGAQLSGDLQRITAEMSAPRMQALQQRLNELGSRLLDANRDYQFAKSRGDEAYYFWKKSLHEGKEDPGEKKKVDEMTAQMAGYSREVDSLTALQDSVSKLVKVVTDSIKAVRSQIAQLYASIDADQSKIDKARGSTVHIRQVMMNDFDRSNFGILKARIDRCQTCHLGWKDSLMADAPEPYTEHPLPELLKIHNPESFGCTPCHHGQGTALTAGYAHGDDDRYWEWPLLKGKEVYASCNGCHSNQTYLKDGDRFNKAKMILSEAGCFGCHEIKGFTDLEKIGPELNEMMVKVKPAWLVGWIHNPKDYLPHTRMPNFRFKEDEAKAIAAYVWDVGKDVPYRPQKGISAGGNAARGKDIVETVGCKDCHVIAGDTRVRAARGFSYDIAPELTHAGSKLDPDWAFEWIKNPRQYRPHTRMPNLRLSDQEARDVVAFLMTQKDSLQAAGTDISLDDPALVKRGDKLIREYGCAGCHVIKGMEKEGRVSVDLSNIARKRIDEIDFGDSKVAHTWDDWIFGKIRDARQYATDRIVSKMPVFAFADSEIVILRTLLRGFSKDIPEDAYQESFGKRLQNIEAGRKLTHYYNCINCHKIEETGGWIKAALDDEAMAPPYLYPEGLKVQEPWLHDFLKGPTPIRPWLKIRMPTFSLADSEITTVSKYFLALHDQDLELRDYRAYQPDPQHVEVGKKLFGELQCLSCHYTGKIPEGKTPADLAPNLAMAKERLKPDWIVSWITNPEAVQPGTRMPSFYPDLTQPSPYSQDFGGSGEEQIKALRDYVLTIQRSK